MAIEKQKGNDPVDGKTVGTYQTKGFTHSGVSGSEVVDRLSENGAKGITTQVMVENNVAVGEKIAKDKVGGRSTGGGMPLDSGRYAKK